MVSLKRLNWDKMERQIENINKKYAKKEVNCSERVFLTVHTILETDVPSKVVTVMSGFGGGVGGTRESVCGAISGGIAALGLIYGRPKPPEGNKEMAYDVARDFYCQFKGKFGSTVCRQLLEDLLRENRYDSDERKERCIQYTLDAAKLCIKTILKYKKVYAV